jgi:hypothetical protein
LFLLESVKKRALLRWALLNHGINAVEIKYFRTKYSALDLDDNLASSFTAPQ